MLHHTLWLGHSYGEWIGLATVEGWIVAQTIVLAVLGIRRDKRNAAS